jgi:hypothetical protein
MQDGAKTLARVWEAAWRAAGSPNLGNQAFTEDQFSGLYMKKDFLPSYTLDQLTTDEHDHIVPTDGAVANGHVTPRPRATPTTVHGRHAVGG